MKKQNNRAYYTEQMLLDEAYMAFPKWLMRDSEFSKLSNDAKVLYVNLKDRFKLSAKNHWIDENGRIFVICKRTSMEKMLHKTKNTITKIMAELEEAHLIEDVQKGRTKPNFIYLLMPKFAGTADDLEFEEDNWTDEENVKK